jgi:hypothetical protein
MAAKYKGLTSRIIFQIQRAFLNSSIIFDETTL